MAATASYGLRFCVVYAAVDARHAIDQWLEHADSDGAKHPHETSHHITMGEVATMFTKHKDDLDALGISDHLASWANIRHQPSLIDKDYGALYCFVSHSVTDHKQRGSASGVMAEVSLGT